MNDMNSDRDLYSQELKELLRESLVRQIGGDFSGHQSDPYFYTREGYPMSTKIDNLPLYPQSIPDLVLSWAKLDRAKERSMEDILVLDLETTGLGRGGTIAIMIGVGYYEKGEFFVEQVFLPDPDAEEHSLDRLRELVESHHIQWKNLRCTSAGIPLAIPSALAGYQTDGASGSLASGATLVET